MNLMSIILKGIRGNVKSYRTYFFATCFAVMVFFVFATLIYHSGLQDLDQLYKGLRKGAIVVEYIIFFFLAFFVGYAIQSYSRIRSKDYGMMKVLGASPAQLFAVGFIENLIIFVGSVISGILFGMALSNLFFMMISKIVGSGTIEVFFVKEAFLLTIGCFIGLFLLLNIFFSFLMQKVNLLRVLQFERNMQTMPRINKKLTILGILLIAAGYCVAAISTGKTVFDLFFPVIILVVLGTYIFYRQSIIYIFTKLKQFTPFYYRGINLLWISDLTARIKSLTWVLFFTTITITIGLTALSSFYSIYYFSQKDLSDLRFPLVIIEECDSEYVILDEVKKTLTEENVEYRVCSEEGFYFADEWLVLMNSATLSRLDTTVTANSVQLKKNEIVLITTERLMLHQQKQIERLQTSEFGFDNECRFSSEQVLSSLALSLPHQSLAIADDGLINRIKDKLIPIKIHFFEYDDKSAASTELQALRGQFYREVKQNNSRFHTTGADNTNNIDNFRIALALSIVVGIIFFLSAGSMLYFNFFNHLQVEQKKYQRIFQIGLSRSEMLKSSNIQMGLIFFLPNVFAFLHTIFAIIALGNAVQIHFLKPVSLAFLGMLIIQLTYFKIIKTQYNKYLIESLRSID